MKYQLIIEASSFQELMEKTKEELNIMSDQELQNIEAENIIKNKFKIACRKNKAWTEYEINFLASNYLSKSIPWIAGKLQRNKTAVYQKLLILYKNGAKKKNNKVKNIILNTYA
jgi:hypothetical protein